METTVEAALAHLPSGDEKARQQGYAMLEEGVGAVPAEASPRLLEALMAVLFSETTKTSEYKQVCALIADCMLRERHGLSTEYWRTYRWKAREAPLFVAAAAKSPHELCWEDMLIMGCDTNFIDIALAKGATEMCDSTGVTMDEVLGRFGEHLLPQACQSNPGIDERRVLLGLEMLREAATGTSHGLTDLQLAGVMSVVAFSIAQRPRLSALALSEGIFDLGVVLRCKLAPDERVTWRSTAGILCGSINMAFVQVGVSISASVLAQHLYSSGAVECACAEFKAFEVRGNSAAALDEANVNTITHGVMTLKDSDLTATEGKMVANMLEAIPSALKFILDYELIHIRELGLTSSALCAQTTAVIFGKREESEGFEFAQKHIAQIVTMLNSMLDGTASAFWPQKSTCFLKPLVFLCVSDANKRMLVREKAQLLTCLRKLLDTVTAREDMTETVQAAVQMDAAESALQLACFAPGRDLLAADEQVMRSLHAMSSEGKSLTSEAKISAEGALLAIEGRKQEPEPEISMGIGPGHTTDRHIMVSYSWDVQQAVERLVRSLQTRGYSV